MGYGAANGLLAGGASSEVGLLGALTMFKARAAEAAGGLERRVSIERHRLNQTSLVTGAPVERH